VHEQLAAAGAHQSADAQDLAGAHLEADALQGLALRAFHAEAPDLEQDLAGMRGPAGEKVLDLAADHVADDLAFGGLSRLQRGDAGAVAQHRDAVGQGEDLVEAVGDVDAGDAAAAQVAQDVQEDRDLGFAQGRGGFVEDEDVRLLAQGLEDLDELAVPHAQGRGPGRGVEVELEAVEQGPSVAVDPVPVDEPAADGFIAQEDVLSHRHFRDKSEFLIDDGDARLFGVGHGLEEGLLPVHRDGP